MNKVFTEFGFSLFLTVVLIWNFAVFVMYGSDKMRAKRQCRRISEKTLILSAFALGGAGAVLGMQIFRHKTKHLKFVVLVPVAAVITVAATFYVCCFLH